jgi:hypothetical protein
MRQPVPDRFDVLIGTDYASSGATCAGGEYGTVNGGEQQRRFALWN